MVRTISLKEVKSHSTAKSVWVIIHNDVYDLTKFLDEHPGGADSLMEVAGKDGTQGFEDVQHSEDAREMMKKYKIGKLPPDEQQKAVAVCCKPKKKGSRSKVNECPSCTTTSCHRLPKARESPSSKSWRTFDRPSSRSPSPKSTSKHKITPPKPTRRVDSIVVPEERRSRGFPCGSGGSGNLKWAILALAVAIVIGVSLKKYMA